MTMQTLTLGGKEYVLIERQAFDEISARAGHAQLPPLPKPDRHGNVPAIEYARATLARKLILARRSAGLSQAELARRAGVRPETINRLENGRNTPDERTFAKIDRALQASEKLTSRRKAS